MADTRAILQSGEVVAGYRIADVIGVGGMAVVYRARQISLERPVALKVLNVALSSDETFRARFRREGTLAASLEHPNIVPVYDSGEDAGRLYIAMRLIDGGTLADSMHRDALTPAAALKLLAPIAGALDVAHEAGLVHRDVKPANILVGKDGHPYLADFGVARGGQSDGLTSTGSFIGSINYASPEQIRGEPLTAASDIYSFTAVVYQCLTGQVPYPRETDAGVMHAHLSEPPPAVPEERLPAAEAVQEIIARGMAKQATERFVSAGTLVEDLRHALEALPDDGHAAPAAFGGIVRVPPSTSGRRDAGTVKGPVPEPTPAGAGDGGRTVIEQRPEPAKPAPAPKPRHAPRPPVRSGRALIWTAVALAVALPILALVLSGGGADTASATAQAGDLGITYDKPWVKQPDDPARSPGLVLADAMTLSTAGSSSNAVVLRAGRLTSAAPVAGALPPSLASQLAGKPVSTPVQAGKVPMVQHDATTKDGRRLRVYTFVTERGQYAIACSAPAGSTTMAGACRDAVATATVAGAQVREPGPDAALAKEVAASLRTLAASRSGASLSGRLSRRADAATKVAKADRRAAAELSGIGAREPERSQIADLRQGLTAEAAALTSLAAAANKRERGEYQKAREQLARAETRIRRALGRLTAMGYDISGAG